MLANIAEPSCAKPSSSLFENTFVADYAFVFCVSRCCMLTYFSAETATYCRCQALEMFKYDNTLLLTESVVSKDHCQHMGPQSNCRMIGFYPIHVAASEYRVFELF